MSGFSPTLLALSLISSGQTFLFALGSPICSSRTSKPTGPRKEEKLINAAKAPARPGAAISANAGGFGNCLFSGYLEKTRIHAAESLARLRRRGSALSSTFPISPNR